MFTRILALLLFALVTNSQLAQAQDPPTVARTEFLSSLKTLDFKSLTKSVEEPVVKQSSAELVVTHEGFAR